MNCPKCVRVTSTSFPGGTTTTINYLDGYCDICKGKRYLNWIEEIFGVRNDFKPDFIYYFDKNSKVEK